MVFFPNCIILNHMSASVCSLNIWRTSTSNKINYRSFTLLHIFYLHTHWVFLICLVRFIPTLWLIQNLAKITVKTHTFAILPLIFTPEKCYIVAERQSVNNHIRMLLSFSKLKKKFYTYKYVSAKNIISALITQCKTFWFITAAIETLKLSVGVTEQFMIASE